MPFLVSSISVKKRTKTRRIVVKTNSFVCFLEEFRAWQFAFEVYWPLSLSHLFWRLISTLLKLEISTLLKTITNSCFQALEGLKFQALEGLKFQDKQTQKQMIRPNNIKIGSKYWTHSPWVSRSPAATFVPCGNL